MNTTSPEPGRTGMILILSGPSGSGKSSIYKAALGGIGGIEFSVSCTTRRPRPGEVDGRDYYFITREKFDSLVAENAFAEHAEVHGNCYGTLKSELLDRVRRGIDVLLDIDVQGAAQLRRLCSDSSEFCNACEFIFIMPPSFEELERRLRARGTETEESILRRLSNAKGEMEHAGEYDHIIVNDDLARAAQEFTDLILGLRNHPKRRRTV
ncbi:MAG: guanylate kinase [Lentisphaeria bacterium]|nr:guanylate kinase [Lentisphaeria bacterium]